MRHAFAGACLGTFTAIMIVMVTVDSVSGEWCEAGEGGLECFRTWFGAFSGWVAALGALAAAYLTMPYLKRQAEHAGRQTDFLIGDAKPTIDADLVGFAEVELRILNWNRRSFVIESVSCDRPQSIDLKEFRPSADDDFVQHLYGNHLDYELKVRGYEDRSRPPHSGTFLLRSFAPRNGKGVQYVNTTFRVKGRLLGDVAEPVDLTARLVVQTFS